MENATNVENSISLTVLNGKVKVCNIVTYEIGEAEVVSDFFKSVDSASSQKYTTVLVNDGAVDSINMSDWIQGNDSTTPSLNAYPDELHQVISKGLETTKGLVDKKGISLKTYNSSMDFKASIELLERAELDFETQIKKLKASSGGANLSDMLDRYFFRKHLLIRGGKGVGKTYAVDERLASEKIDNEFIAGHEGMESIDLLGYYIKDETGAMVWLDGALSKAFRKAKDAECCLFFDEILRMPSRELNILVGALTPTSRGTYRLRTNRVIDIAHGIGETEVLEVPVKNLWCVATTNIGAGYQVDDIDDALSDRFRIVDKTVSTEELQIILTSYATISGVSEAMVNKLIDFYTQSNDLVTSGELEKEVNLRHLSEVIQFSKSDVDIKEYMFDLVPTWCSTDANGTVNKSEREIINKLIKKII